MAFLRLEDRRQRFFGEVHPPWVGMRVIARVITAAMSLIGLSLFAAAIPRWDRTFIHHKGPTKGAWQDGLPIAPVGLPWPSTSCQGISKTIPLRALPANYTRVSHEL